MVVTSSWTVAKLSLHFTNLCYCGCQFILHSTNGSWYTCWLCWVLLKPCHNILERKVFLLMFIILPDVAGWIIAGLLFKFMLPLNMLLLNILLAKCNFIHEHSFNVNSLYQYGQYNAQYHSQDSYKVRPSYHCIHKKGVWLLHLLTVL